ncbi:MAG: hypothetical protein V3R25_09995 [Nitrosomonadaceae bacterium]
MTSLAAKRLVNTVKSVPPMGTYWPLNQLQAYIAGHYGGSLSDRYAKKVLSNHPDIEVVRAPKSGCVERVIGYKVKQKPKAPLWIRILNASDDVGYLVSAALVLVPLCIGFVSGRMW